MEDVELGPVLDALDAVYGTVTGVVTGLTGAQMMLPSRCAGWAVADVLYHQLLDARRALRVFATPAAGTADRSDVTYWRAWTPGTGDSAAHARHVRIVASAYQPEWLRWEWGETAGAACRAARACTHELVATQGHVLRLADFAATLAVEAAVHYLDLTVSLPAAPVPDPASLALVRRVLVGLLGSPLPASWDDPAAALKGTGRLPLTPGDRAALGPLAERFPVFS